MNKKLMVMSLAPVMVLVNQGFAMSHTVKVDDVMKVEKTEDNKVILNMNASMLKEKVSEGDTIKLTVPGKIGEKQVELAPKAFYNLDMNGASLQLTFEDGVKFPEDCSYMFAFDASNKESPITSIDFGDVDTSNVTKMNHMFWGCDNLKSLNLSNFNTQKVKDMSDMFFVCNSLNSLNVSNFNTQNVTKMDYMFHGCKSLKSLDVSKFDTQNVTKMNHMFWGCEALKLLNVSKFDTQNVKDMSNMFQYCSSLNSLDLSSFNTQNVENMKCMFTGCPNLTSLNLSNFDTQNVKNMESMFDGYTNLTSLKVNKNSFNKDILSQLPKGVKIIDIASLEAKRNELNQIYWRIVANNAIVNADPKGKHGWIKDDNEYGESIMEVIGKAIGDCVTKQNEFANPTEDGLIVFKGTEPEDYEPEHWNAVLLYNFVYRIIAKNNTLSTERLLDDVIEDLRVHYAPLDTPESSHYKIPSDKINRAKLDIIEYDSALRLRKRLNEYSKTCRKYKKQQEIQYLAPNLWRDSATFKDSWYGTEKHGYTNYVCFSPEITIEKNNEQRTVLRPSFYGYNNKKLTISKVTFFHYNRIPDDPSCWTDDHESFKEYNTRKEIPEHYGSVLKRLFGDLVEFYDE